MSDAADELLQVGNMQEFVRPMSIRTRTEHSCDNKLSLGPNLTQKSHKRNRRSFCQCQLALSIVRLTRFMQNTLQKRRVLRRVEAFSRNRINHCHFGIIRRVLCQTLYDIIFSLFFVFSWRKSD